ncbi:MAG: cytochrome P450 [Candidatus Binatia bacterium]
MLETLRLEQSEFLFRTVCAPIEVEGFRMPAGWLLRLCVRESHRDPAVFAEPDRFDPERFVTPPGRLAYSPFGVATSRHACLGEALTKTVASVVLAELGRGFTWRTVADGPREFDGWHWTPSPNFRIALARFQTTQPKR